MQRSVLAQQHHFISAAFRAESLTMLKITEELKQRLIRHEAWLNSPSDPIGERLVLVGDYKNVDFTGANFTKAVIGANLRGAGLHKAKFDDAEMAGCDLRDSDISDASFVGVFGLIETDLAGANLTRAVLPDNLCKFEMLKTVEEMSKNSGKYLIGLLAANLLALLTISSTSDVGFFTDTSTATLPIINVAVSTVTFYTATPIILAGFFLFFHMDMQRLWDALAKLPAVFPDGRPLYARAYPWILNGLVVPSSAFFDPQDAPLMKLQVVTAVFLAWWVTPIMLLMFWLRYLRRHDWAVTSFHMLLVACTVVGSLHLYRLACRTLKRSAVTKGAVRSSIMIQITLFAVTMSLLILISDGAVNGVGHRPNDIKAGMALYSPRKLVPSLFEALGYKPFADLSEADVSTRPSGWNGQAETGRQIDYSGIRGARLSGRDLRNATMDNSFLIKADLTNAQLTGASMTQVDLRYACLYRKRKIMTTSREF